MENIYNFNAKFLIIALCILLTNISISCQINAPEKVNLKVDKESNQKDTVSETNSYEDECLKAEYPESKTRINAGVMNGKAIDIPKPEYPYELKEKNISGSIKAEVVIDEEGKVIWAKVDNGHPELQALVKTVVCKASFKAPTISGIPYSVGGIIIYNFVLPKKNKK